MLNTRPAQNLHRTGAQLRPDTEQTHSALTTECSVAPTIPQYDPAPSQSSSAAHSCHSSPADGVFLPWLPVSHHEHRPLELYSNPIQTPPPTEVLLRRLLHPLTVFQATPHCFSKPPCPPVKEHTLPAFQVYVLSVSQVRERVLGVRGLALFASNLQSSSQTRRKREAAGQPGARDTQPRGDTQMRVRSGQEKCCQEQTEQSWNGGRVVKAGIVARTGK